MPDKDTVKIFTKDTENINLLGHLITSKVSRDIMNLLAEEELFASQIAKKTNTDLSLVFHHLKKMEQCNLLIITEKQITKKGNYHKLYKVVPNIFITVSETQKEVHESGFLKRIFRDGVKFSVITVSGGITWWVSVLSNTTEKQVPIFNVHSSNISNKTEIITKITCTILKFTRRTKRGKQVSQSRI